MYESYFELNEKPFSLLPDPEFLFMSRQHQKALTLLEYGLMNQAGFIILTGEIGSGKTTLMRHLLSRLDSSFSVGLISNTHQTLGELMDWVCMAFDLPAEKVSKLEKYQYFIDFLIKIYGRGRRVLLIVDEAQNLGVEKLEELRLLSNINAGKDLLLQLMLLGQPQLRDLLRDPTLEQFAQRVTASYHLGPLDSDETERYIRHRIAVAGGQSEIFTHDACWAIYHYSQGVPRLINLICDTALVYAYGAEMRVLNGSAIDEFVASHTPNLMISVDLDHESRPPAPRPVGQETGSLEIDQNTVIPPNPLRDLDDEKALSSAVLTVATANPEEVDQRHDAELSERNPADIHLTPQTSGDPDQAVSETERHDESIIPFSPASGETRFDDQSVDLNREAQPSAEWSRWSRRIDDGVARQRTLNELWGATGSPQSEQLFGERLVTDLPIVPKPVTKAPPSRQKSARDGRSPRDLDRASSVAIPNELRLLDDPAQPIISPPQKNGTPLPWKSISGVALIFLGLVVGMLWVVHHQNEDASSSLAETPLLSIILGWIGMGAQTTPQILSDLELSRDTPSVSELEGDPIAAAEPSRMATERDVLPHQDDGLFLDRVNQHAERQVDGLTQGEAPRVTRGLGLLGQGRNTIEDTTRPIETNENLVEMDPPVSVIPDLSRQLEPLAHRLELDGMNRLVADLGPLVQFDDGSVDLQPAAQDLLEQIAEILREYPDLRIRILAHTDSSGPETVNLTLSRQRAQAVEDFLRGLDIDWEQLSSEGRGQLELRADREEERRLGPWVNRRIEIEVRAE
ncbi:hypothetical protein CKO25_09430 [Thiocapsa imhoffii]|uniref:OmpA-like domain-containing protein n=1 Tax=Thiocapsa imhoffii TaxID=382777 RepID=A0A9X0WHY0_9GAMM|nr:AAA family ATPase [Thiocapsa imhoffii]MBK1644865.1 hypothetical protein [Thiocapsa imhoffii]